MKPYYEEPGITIYHGDCREILPQLEPVDLVLTDFPYGVNENYINFLDTQKNLKALIKSSWDLIKIKSKVILLTCGVSNIGLYEKPKWIMAWVTPAGAGSGPWGFCTWQPILCYGSDPYLKNGLGRRPDSFIHTESSEKSLHPCEKPIKLWKKVLLRGSVKEDGIILDPFMGSGTTLRAAKDLGRKAIGIEIEEKYCEIAAKRLRQEVFNF